MRSRARLADILMVVAYSTTLVAQTPPARYAGRPLADVLRDLQAQRLNIVFSSELVRADMRVANEPKATAPRKMLDEVLRPHGLEVRSGAGGALLVVRGRKAAPPRTGRAAATGGITGTVVDARTATPLPGVVIAVSGTARETTTDEEGAFVLTDLPVGALPLYVSLVGYGLARPIVDVSASGMTAVTIPLADGTGTYTEAVTVVGDAFRGTRSNVPVQHALSSSDITDLRGVLTDDPFRAIQGLPAVATGNDFRSEFSIRASDFRHLGMSIDGMAVPWLVHAIRDRQTVGSIAMLNGDIVDDLTMTAGVYPQQRPGRTGAWIDFTIREGSRARTELHGAVSATSASAVAEGPLGTSRRGSWLVSFRQSYLQWLLKRLDYQSTTFGFTDAQSKLVYDVTPRQQFQLTTIVGRSRFEQSEEDPGPSSLGLGLGDGGLVLAGWRSTFGSSTVLTQRLGVTRIHFRNEGQVTPLLGQSTSSEVSYHADVAWTPRPPLMIQMGTYLQRQQETTARTQFLETLAGSSGARRRASVDGSASAASGDARVVWTAPKGITLDAGVRLTHATLTDQSIATPWLLGAWRIGPSWSLRAGAGLASQVPELDQVIGTYGRLDVRAERARNFDVAIEHRPTSTVQWQVAVYDRRERDMLRLQDSETRIVNGRLVFAAARQPFWQNALAGSSRGVELVVQRRDPARFNGWIGYSYGKLRYDDAGRGESFWADVDQRHTLSTYGQYRLSPQTSVGAKLRVGSNVPYAGYFDERPGGLFAGTERNTVRLPTYARLDLRADRTFNYDKRRLTLFVEIINVLNRTNVAPANGIIGFTGRAVEFTDQMFPLLPSAGVRIDF